MEKEHEIFLGLGTNQGDKKENLKRAIEQLSLALGTYTSLSSFIETEPWGFESDTSFLNCVVAFKTALPPMELLDITESIERELGRSTKSTGGIYHDRIIDIDILLYGNEVINTERLTVPHPLMHKRDFVMTPLCEIAPQTLHPVIGKSLAKIKEENDSKR